MSVPDNISATGEWIYAEHYKTRLEREHPDDYVAIDVITGEAYVAEFPELALGEAITKAPTGVFYLIRIGAPAAFYG